MVIEYQRDLTVMVKNAQIVYFTDKMNIRKSKLYVKLEKLIVLDCRQVLCNC